MKRAVPPSVLSLGVQWASRISSVGLEFALPPLVGSYLDRRWGLRSVLTIVGAVLGFAIGMAHLMTIARLEASAGSSNRTDPGSESPKKSSDGSQ